MRTRCRLWFGLTLSLVGAVLLGVAPAGRCSPPERPGYMTLRPDQTLFWFGHRITSPFRVEVRGDSIALNDEPDLGGPRASAQEALAELPRYMNVPYSRQLAATGIEGAMVIAMTDSAVMINANRMVYAYQTAVTRGTDGLAAARAAADPLVIDLSQPIRVTGPSVYFTTRGLGPANLITEASTRRGPPQPRPARRERYTGANANDRLQRLRSNLRDPGRKVIFVTLPGYSVYSGEMAERVVAEVDSVTKGLLVPRFGGHTTVPWRVLEGVRMASERSR